jgi:beta-galactosidase
MDVSHTVFCSKSRIRVVHSTEVSDVRRRADTSFYYDIPSNIITVGSGNVIAVRSENLGKNSRWYSGAGIFRHVWLYTLPSTHINIWGASVRTFAIKTAGDSVTASVEVNVTVSNKGVAPSKAAVSVHLLDKTGAARGTSAQSGSVAVPVNSTNTTVTITIPMKLSKREMWSTETPELFSANITLNPGADEDVLAVSFGVRTLSFTTDGFFLNGKSTKLRGGAMHNDNGPLGSATIDRAEERRIQILKGNGCEFATRCLNCLQ